MTLIRRTFLILATVAALASPAFAQRQSVPVTTGGTGRSGNWPVNAANPSIGFAPGGADNGPKIRTLMNAISPVATVSASRFAGGYDVVIPGIPGQLYTSYYFGRSFELSRNAHYHCGSTALAGLTPSVLLVFPAGIDGVIQADSSTSPDGGQGSGELSGCGVLSLGSGSGYTGGGSTVITSVGQYGDPSGAIPTTPWAVGDGILITPARAGFHTTADEPLAAHGAYVSSVTPPGTLTLAAGFSIANNFTPSSQEFIQNGSNNFLNGDTMTVGNNTFTFGTGTPGTGQIKIGANWAATAASLISSITTNAADTFATPQWGKPTNTPNVTANAFGSTTHVYFSALTGGTVGDALPATFTTSGPVAGSFDAYFSVGTSPIIANGDTMVIGNTTLHFKTGALSAAGDIQIVAGNNNATLNNVITVLNRTCSGTTCITPSPTPNVHALLGYVPTIGSTGWYLPLYSTAGGGPTTYTGAARSFRATTFSGSGSTFGGGRAVDQVSTWQLPATRKFSGVTATLGSSSITVNAGPRPLRQGDWIWSKAFTYGATVMSVGGKTFPQTATVGNAFMSGAMNAVASDSGGQLWVIPDALKRETGANTSYNAFLNFPNGLQEGCVGFVCGGNNYGNSYGGDMLGRITQGHNTAGTNSFGEIDHVSTLAAVMEGGTLGSNYYGFNANTNDNGAWSFIGNCVNQNTTMFLGGYAPATNPYCADPVNGIFPTSNAGNLPIFMGQSNGHGPPGTPGMQTGLGNNMAISGGMTFSQGGTSLCMTGGGTYLFGFSSDNACGSPFTWFTQWNASAKAFDVAHWLGSNELVERYAATDNGYIGYAGPSGTSLIFPYGVVVSNIQDGNVTADARNICMSLTMPTSANYKKGDICFNTNPAHGSPMGWVDLNDGANFIPLANVP